MLILHTADPHLFIPEICPFPFLSKHSGRTSFPQIIDHFALYTLHRIIYRFYTFPELVRDLFEIIFLQKLVQYLHLKAAEHIVPVMEYIICDILEHEQFFRIPDDIRLQCIGYRYIILIFLYRIAERYRCV